MNKSLVEVQHQALFAIVALQQLGQQIMAGINLHGKRRRLRRERESVRHGGWGAEG